MHNGRCRNFSDCYSDSYPHPSRLFFPIGFPWLKSKPCASRAFANRTQIRCGSPTRMEIPYRIFGSASSLASSDSVGPLSNNIDCRQKPQRVKIIPLNLRPQPTIFPLRLEGQSRQGVAPIALFERRRSLPPTYPTPTSYVEQASTLPAPNTYAEH
jgi:hypothetical protein